MAGAPNGHRAWKPLNVRWVIATDPALTDIVGGGTVRTTRALDWTVKVDASGLSSATTYYYAFGALGRTPPLSVGPARHRRRGMRWMRCASRTRPVPPTGRWISIPTAALPSATIWSLFCHAGDHVYEFVDTKGWYRARNDRFDLEDVDFRKWFDGRGMRPALCAVLQRPRPAQGASVLAPSRSCRTSMIWTTKPTPKPG